MAADKKINYGPIEREIEVDGAPAEHWLYTMKDRLIANYHPDLVECRIKLFWAYEWKPDRDSHLKLGCAKKVAEETMLLTDFDVFIELNYPFFNDPEVEMFKKESVLDHELCHPRPLLDKDSGEQKVDVNGNKQWYLRGHDIEEFREIVERRGCYKQDLEEFAAALFARRALEEQANITQNQTVQEGDTVVTEGGDVGVVQPIPAPQAPEPQSQPLPPEQVEPQSEGQQPPAENGYNQLTAYEQPEPPPPPPQP